MSLYIHAVEAIRDCESRLRTLISEAAAAGELEQLKAVADLAMAVRNLVPRNVVAPTHAPAPNPTPTPRKPSLGSHAYPRFDVEGERLVKIGWSKRERAEYEHKVPMSVAQAAFFATLRMLGRERFRMEELFPLLVIEGKAIPSYQSYLVLSWLRSLELIEKVGKDSYRWTTDDVDEESFQACWEITAQSR